VTDREVTAILAATSPNLAFYVGATALAVVLPRVAAVGYLVIAVVAILRARGDSRAAEPA
jgi:hypothetical protein